jgi:hypothetical protein
MFLSFFLFHPKTDRISVEVYYIHIEPLGLGLEFRVEGVGFRVYGLGFRIRAMVMVKIRVRVRV